MEKQNGEKKKLYTHNYVMFEAFAIGVVLVLTARWVARGICGFVVDTALFMARFRLIALGSGIIIKQSERHLLYAFPRPHLPPQCSRIPLVSVFLYRFSMVHILDQVRCPVP